MSIPETPYTRKEAYLNAAATGDTSGIPERPYTREEMYLDAIAKNGGGGGGGGSSTLSGLTDVDISNPTDGQTLVYNATSGKWENGADGVFVVHDVEGTLDKTWQEIYGAFAAAKIVVIHYAATEDGAGCGLPTFAEYDENNGYVVSNPEKNIAYITQTPNGYPVAD